MTAPEVKDRVARLARILRDHECWEHPGWVIPRGTMNERFMYTLIDQALLDLIEHGRPEHDALRAAIREVESGEVFGSPTRCCVCGEGGDIAAIGSAWIHAEDVRCSDAWHYAFRSGTHPSNDLVRHILRARRLYREGKAKPLRSCENCGKTFCDWGQGGSIPMACGGEGWRPEPAPNPVREWGMECPPSECGLDDQSLAWATWKRELFGLCGYIMLDGGRRRQARRIRAEVPSRKPYVAFHEVPIASWRDTCARKDCAWKKGNGKACRFCSGWRQADTWMGAPGTARSDWFHRAARARGWGAAEARRREREFAREFGALCYGYAAPVSGNPRGDDFLRALWREDEKRTQALRDAEALRRTWDRVTAVRELGCHVHCGKCGGVAIVAPVRARWRCTACGAESSSMDRPPWREWTGGVHP